MAAFLTIVIHFGVSYLHVLFAYRFYERRNETYAVFTFWIMMVMWAQLHAAYGILLTLEELDKYNALYYVLVFFTYSVLPFITSLMIPIFIAELTVPPKKKNALASMLLVISRNARMLFYVALAICALNVLWSLVNFMPLDQWRGNYADRNAQYGMFGLAAVWALMLMSGIRSGGRWHGVEVALRVIFFLIVAMWLYEYNFGFGDYWSVGPVVTTVTLSFVFSWYRFRLQFMDMILNQCVGMVMLVLIAIGLERLVSSDSDVASSVQFLILSGYLLVAGFFFWLVNRWFSRLWAPDEQVLMKVHAELPVILASCKTENEAISETENLIKAVFYCDVSINGSASFPVENTLKLEGNPAIELRLGYIRGWIPWLSHANSWVRTAALYLHSHLQIQNSHTSQMKAEALSALAARAELNAMRAQIRPHFLFNTLNSIHSFVRDDPKQAERVIEQLSELMRSVLTSPDEDTIPLEKELNVVKNYLAIEKSRYGERLQYEILIADELNSWQVPPFSLQPLVENVIKHAVEGQFEPVQLRVEALADKGHMVIKVIDDGPGFAGMNEGLGIATKNIRERLERLYGNKASLRLVANDSGGVTASLQLPAELEQNA